MSSENNGSVRSIEWNEIFPWLSLLRVFRVATGARVLFLAVAGMLATASGWWLLGAVFHPAQEAKLLLAEGACPWKSLTRYIPDQPDLIGLSAPPPMAVRDLLVNPLTTAWGVLSEPLGRGLGRGVTLRGLAHLICCGLWGVAVWAFFGGAITRIAAVKLAADETTSLLAAVRHAARKWLAYVGAPLLPLLGVALVVVPLALVGLMMRMQLGIFLFGVAWIFMLVGGLMMTLLLLGLIFGWPLMWATVSTEASDSFDALSRSFAYVFQRPLHYLFYAVTAAVLCGLGWLLVSQLAAGVIYLTHWAVAWAPATHICRTWSRITNRWARLDAAAPMQCVSGPTA